jgi:hypothetical protein
MLLGVFPKAGFFDNPHGLSCLGYLGLGWSFSYSHNRCVANMATRGLFGNGKVRQNQVLSRKVGKRAEKTGGNSSIFGVFKLVFRLPELRNVAKF